MARPVERIVVVGLFAAAVLMAQPYTRGIGIYPGDPREDSGPVLQLDHNTYRNLALHRSAYQSSSYDYNLTAQLVTDGIVESKLPRWIAVSTSQAGYLPRPQRETLLDHNPYTTLELLGSDVWIEIELHGGEAPLEADRIDIAMASNTDSSGWICLISGSDDGRQYRELGRGAPATTISIPFAAPSSIRRYRIEFRSATARTFTIADIGLFRQNRKIEIAGPFDFTSAWMSASSGTEWIYVDLGAPCTFDRVDLHWIRRAAEAELQISDNAATWRSVAPALADSVKFPVVEARYVRLLMTKPASPEGYILSEMAVYGRGGPVAHDKTGPSLASGWHLQRDSLVHASGEELSRPGYSDRDWVPATVPGAVLASYYNIGAIPDPLYGDNQLAISDSFFYADFWYRNEFTAPPRAPGQRLWLHFDGINWKAGVFLNGEKLGRIEGGFQRARFDVSGHIHPGRNALAVLVEKNANPGTVHEKTAETPGKNGGALGADNPTFHASVGWDWIPTIRGRNIGIWNKVYFTTTGSVTLEDPSVTTKLTPDLSHAQVTIEVTLHNYGPNRITGSFKGRFGEKMGFGHSVALEAGDERTTWQSFDVPNPRLWWPNGYGEPYLYPVELRFDTYTNQASDSISFQAGLREFTYSEEGGALRIWINGKRFIPRGGNWGFSEAMLRYRAREYDAAVRYHRDMNFNMIRNWVGQTGDDAFYDACDRNGIVVWQDFWLANPADGPDPDDAQMFLRNARDTVLRIRRHPSIGLYCGRNEGFPPKPIDDGIRAILNELAPGIHYIPSSADGPVSGHGPYRVMPPAWYFAERATPKLHSEMGMPAVPPLENVEAMMPAADRWPQREIWGLHDFTATGAQGGGWFRNRIDHSYGGASTLPAWLDLAQFVDYEGYRAMFEAQSKNRMGLLLWMSHPAWPSFVWQTYDYYLEPTAAYFGAKKGAEPLHIQWNPLAETVEVVNYTGASVPGLTARAEIHNLDGSVAWKKEAAVDSSEDSAVTVFPIEYPPSLTPVHFLKLTLLKRGRTEPISENFYWRGIVQDDFRALRELPKVAIDVSTHVERSGDHWLLTTMLHNTGRVPALMVRLKAVRETTGDRILPALYSDNYISLMPGEQRTIRTEVADRDTRGERPRITVNGFNVSSEPRP